VKLKQLEILVIDIIFKIIVRVFDAAVCDLFVGIWETNESEKCCEWLTLLFI